VAPFATLLLLPILPAIIVTGTLAAVLAVIAVPVGQVVAWVAWLFLSYMLAVVKGGASLPVAAFDLGEIHPVIIWGYYGVIALAFMAYHRRNQVKAVFITTADFLSGPVKRWLVPALLITAILTTFFAVTIPDDRTHVSFLDIGQGDAILIQSGSTDILVDGGPSPREIVLELGKKLPFWDRTIELVVLTHPHADHLTGLVEVLKRYRVKQVLYTEADSTSALWLEWERLVEEKRIQRVKAQSQQIIAFSNGNIAIEVLSAPAFRETDSFDNGGIVLRVSDGKISFLLTADVTEGVEVEMMMERVNLDSDVLKVAHHGSSTGTSAGFLAVVSPEAAVISVGADNDYGHPHTEVMERLASALSAEHIYRTDIDGTIEIITDGERLWVRKGR
jgi:competence protein ComEC